MSWTADRYIYDETIEDDYPEHPFINKEIQIVYDSNNGVYNNQILFSTQSIIGSGKYIDYQNSYIEIPFVMALQAPADISAVANPFMMGLKDGSIQLVDSIILQYNGTSMVQQSIFTNMIQHFKILSSWTQEDLNKWGPSTFLAPDNPLAYRFTNNAASASGDGLSNNRVTPYLPSTSIHWRASNMAWNEGLLKRMRNYTNCNPTAAPVGSNGLVVLNQGKSDTVGRANFYASSTTIYVWDTVLTLRLKDLHDFFNKLPILKSARIDMTINFNSFNGTVTYVAGAANTDGSLVTTTYSQTAGHCCPFMLAAAAVQGGASTPPTSTQPNGILTGGSGIYTVGCGVNGIPGQAAFSAIRSSIFNGCRWYIPLYEMNPDYEENSIVTNPMKSIYYDDFYTYTNISNQTGSFQTLLSAGVPNPKYLLLFPYFNGAVANSGNVMSNSPYQSFFDTAPATTSPISLTNFQVQCGGKTVFPLIEQYDFQQYMEEFSSIFAYNGGKAPIITSGLLTQAQWNNSPVYVVDIARRLPLDLNTNKSVQVSATINSANPVGGAGTTATIDIVAFIVYQRKATFNVVNGLLQPSETY